MEEVKNFWAATYSDDILIVKIKNANEYDNSDHFKIKLTSEDSVEILIGNFPPFNLYEKDSIILFKAALMQVFQLVALNKICQELTLKLNIREN